MKKHILGKNYDFIVRCTKTSAVYKFYVETRHNITRTHSYINNLNCILSEFRISINDKKVSESQWVVPEKEAHKYAKKAVDFLTDADFRKYVEQQLDLDRSLGNWNKMQ